MASGDTKTNQYLDIAANGTRADLPTDTCCETRSQTLIRGVAERIITEEETRAREDAILQGEIDEIKNNPDVVDIVATYADLQDYDTQHLSNNDIIRVLADETHNGESTYYRFTKNPDTWTYIGTAGDYYTKTQTDTLLDSKQDLLTAGDGITIEEESGALVISSTGGGGGTSNFNQLTNRPQYNGTMMTGSTNIPEVKTYSAGTGLDLTGTTFSADTTVLATKTDLDSKQDELTAGDNVTIEDESGALVISATDTTYSNFTGTDGTAAGAAGLVPAPATTDAGKFLKADGDWTTISEAADYVLSGAGAPTTSTVGTVGKLYEDTTNGKLYICTAADTVTPSYTWVEVGAGGGGGGITELTSADYNWPTGSPDGIAYWLLDDGQYHIASGISFYTNAATTVTSEREFFVWTPTSGQKTCLEIRSSDQAIAIRGNYIATGDAVFNGVNYLKDTAISQSTGTSTSSVMSQNAVTSMVFADPSTKLKVQLGASASASGDRGVAIGGSAYANTNSVAIGYSSTANNTRSAAIGWMSSTTEIGEVSIGGSSVAGNGYNGSQYRLLTNVYDPQTAHDAATKNYVDAISISGAGAPTTATAGTVGQLYQDTTNGKLYICTAIVPGTDPDPDTYTWVEVGAGRGSGITELTSADYNYPTSGTADGVALWLLDDGIYTVDIGAKVYIGTNVTTIGERGFYAKGTSEVSGTKYVTISVAAASQTKIYALSDTYSASQIANYINATLTQSTGIASDYVMSQNATTSMVYADPSTKYRVQIGASASVSTSGTDSIAIGRNSSTASPDSIVIGRSAGGLGSDKKGSIALGAYSGAGITAVGMMDIGSSATSNGYNSSNYRLLTGLYDPQSAHDAATKGYVDPTTDSSAPTTATVGRLGQIFIDTTNADAYMCVAVDSVTPSYTWKKLNA